MLKEINQDEYKKQIEGKDQGLYLLVFHALWCPPCRMFKESLEKINDRDNVTVYRVDVDQNHDLVNEFEVRSMPTWIVFNKGKQLFRSTGYQEYEELKRIVLAYK